MNNLLHFLLQIDSTGVAAPAYYPDWLITSLFVGAGVLLVGVIIYAIVSNRKAAVSTNTKHSNQPQATKREAQKQSITLVQAPINKIEKSDVIKQEEPKAVTPTTTPLKKKEPPIKEATPNIPVKKETTTPQPQIIIKEPVVIKPKETVAEVHQPVILPKVTIPAKIEASPEEQSRPKYIGYTPLNIFEQTEPFNYPFVVMPKAGCVIKFPRKGRTGRKGYKEAAFLEYIKKYFSNIFQVFDDRFILVKNNPAPLEPDITLIDEKKGINLFIDIEIDEPYEGTNNIATRQATHYIGCDTKRNNALKSRGWITIRFAEIQVHRQPDSCCLFIADVIKTVSSSFQVPAQLKQTNEVHPVAQWTKAQAEAWSREKYREQYLGITQFGRTPETERLSAVEETSLGNEIETKVIEEEVRISEPRRVLVENPLVRLIQTSISSHKFISFTYDGKKTIVKPIKLEGSLLSSHCYVKNEDKRFEISKIKDAELKDAAFTIEAKGPLLGIERIRDIVKTAMRYDKHIRIRYTKRAWPELDVDQETGEIYFIKIQQGEVSVRTISNVKMAAEVLNLNEPNNYWVNDNYITAYCNKRDEQRTFKFDRISEIAILNI